MTSNVECIMYINLKHRVDRKDQISKDLLQFFPQDKIKRFEAILNTENGHIGCGISHIGVLQYAIDHKLKNIMIVEDDFYFFINKDTLDKKLNNLFNNYKNFNIAQIGVNLKKGRILDNDLCEVYDSQAPSCYIVNSSFFEILKNTYKEGIEKLIREGKSMSDYYAIDQYWKKLQGQGSNFLAFHPKIGGQRTGYSDTEKRVVQYNC